MKPLPKRMRTRPGIRFQTSGQRREVFRLSQKLRNRQHLMARENPDGDPILDEILLASLSFGDGQLLRPLIHDGIVFYPVGRNSTHDFALGTKEGKRFRLAVGETGTLDNDGIPESETHVRELAPEDESWGYIGHW